MSIFTTLTILALFCSVSQAAYKSSLRSLVADLQNRRLHRRIALRNYESELDSARRSHIRSDFEKKAVLECDALDVAFVLDESGSIYGPDFETQLLFIQNIVDTFKVSPDGTHIAIETFSDDPTEIMTLGQHVTNLTAMALVIKGIKQHRGNTKTDKALDVLRSSLLSPSAARPGIPHIGIVITDGESDDTTATLQQASAAKHSGITLFTIGVGRKVNEKELESMASAPEYAFQVGKYDDLMKRLKDIIPEAACKVTTVPPPLTTTLPQMIEECDGSKPLDIMFAAPDEAGIRDSEFALAFIQDVVGDFKISSYQVQVGLTPRLCGDLEGIQMNQHDMKEPLLEDIRDRRLKSTVLSMQLDYLIYEAFREEAGDRRRARDVAILIVDNQASDPGETFALANEARQEGITLITVGVGDYVDRDQLMQVAASPQHAFFVENYEALLGLTQEIRDALCSEIGPPQLQLTTTTVPPTTPPQIIEGCDDRTPIDILYAAPDEAGILDTDYSLEFLAALSEKFLIGEDQVQVGVTPRLCGDLEGLSLGDNDDKTAVLEAIGSRRLAYTLLSQQLDYVVNTGFRPETGSRPDARKVFLLVADNASADRDLTNRLAEAVKAKGVILITIGVGSYVDQAELAYIASSASHTFYVRSYSELQGIQADVLGALCEG